MCLFKRKKQKFCHWKSFNWKETMYIQIGITYHVLSTICRKKKCVFVEVKLGYAQNCICSFRNEVRSKVNKPLLEMQVQFLIHPRHFLAIIFVYQISKLWILSSPCFYHVESLDLLFNQSARFDSLHTPILTLYNLCFAL